MKKILFAAALAATAASAQAAVTFAFAGAEFGGAAVSGTLAIDTSALGTANGASPPATSYFYATGDAASTSALPFLSVSFTSAGSQPTLLTSGDSTYQLLQGDPADGSFTLRLDTQRTNPDTTLTSSSFVLSGAGLTGSMLAGGVLLPDFANAGSIFFDVQSGTGPTETFDVESAGQLAFTAPAAVPEASTWAMLVMGFGAVGYAARRRTRVARAA